MKTFLFLTLLCAVVLSGSMTRVSTAANEGRKQKATVRFIEPVNLQGVTLKGEYLFVHDDMAMMRGEACTYVYRGTVESLEKLVISFHCIPVTGAKATRFSVTTARSGPDIELRAFQFAGDTETHLVPPVK